MEPLEIGSDWIRLDQTGSDWIGSDWIGLGQSHDLQHLGLKNT